MATGKFGYQPAPDTVKGYVADIGIKMGVNEYPTSVQIYVKDPSGDETRRKGQWLNQSSGSNTGYFHICNYDDPINEYIKLFDIVMDPNDYRWPRNDELEVHYCNGADVDMNNKKLVNKKLGVRITSINNNIIVQNGTVFYIDITTNYLQYSYTILANAGGNVSPTSGSVNPNASVNITATSNEGYGFDKWESSGGTLGSNSSASTTFQVTSNGAWARASFTKYAIAWESEAKLEAKQTEYKLKFTLTGRATQNISGGTIIYEVYKLDGTADGKHVATLSSGTAEITLEDSELEQTVTYQVRAFGTYNGATVQALNSLNCPIALISVHKTVKYYNGSNWIECIVNYYNGENWIEVEPYYYNGTDWVLCSHT